ncbi:hypothetical protein B0H14DRAFT_3165860 [Mycena olivaceomarginata]|nr:hypothetical protein B0H14DRAFT_3165860 [Mycena olivaceomarginata]
MGGVHGVQHRGRGERWEVGGRKSAVTACSSGHACDSGGGGAHSHTQRGRREVLSRAGNDVQKASMDHSAGSMPPAAPELSLQASSHLQGGIPCAAFIKIYEGRELLSTMQQQKRPEFLSTSHSQPHIAEPLTASQVTASESGSDNGVSGAHEEILEEAVNTPSDDDKGTRLAED